MKSLKIFALLVLCIMSSSVMAQRKYFMKDHRKASFINNVDVSVGMYNPSLDALNQYWSVLNTDATFDGGLKYGLGVYAHLYMDGYIGLTAGYYQDEVSTTGNTFANEQLTEIMKYTAIPIGFRFVHEFHLGDPFLHRPRAAGLLLIHPYLGIGTSFWNMTEDYTRSQPGTADKVVNLSTVYQTVTGIAGVKYTLAKMIDIGIEYNYEAGGFAQAFEAATPTTQDVSVNGHVISFKVSYLINSRIEWRYVQKVRRFR